MRAELRLKAAVATAGAARAALLNNALRASVAKVDLMAMILALVL